MTTGLRYKKHKLCLIIAGAILLFSVIGGTGITVSADGGNLNILILNSYSNFLWTDNLDKGIMSALNGMDAEYTIYTESLDFKRFPEKEYQDLLVEQYTYKYKNRKMDMIITTDDQALLFALEHRADLFSNAPIVFSGVYKDTADRIMETNEGLTGVYEKLDIENTLKYSMQLNKKLKKVYLISEPTDMGNITEDKISSTIKALAPQLEVISLSNMDFNDMLDFVSKLNSDSVLMLGAYSQDKLKEHYGGQNVAEIISRRSTVPLYVLYDYSFGTGAIGGSLLIAEDHGRKAGEFAADIINGGNISGMEPDEGDYYKPMFDYNTLLKYGIPLGDLPRDSVVINRQISFFERYKTGVTIVVGIFLFMVLFITALLYNIFKRLRAEQKLIEKNDVIRHLYETVSRSEDKLQMQYNELLETKNQLVVSEERYRLVTDASSDIIFDYFFDTGSFYFPERSLVIYGHAKHKVQYEEFRTWIRLEDDLKLKELMDRYLKGESPILYAEILVNVDEKRFLWYSMHAKAIWKDGKPVRMSGCFMDITEKKENLQMIENLAYCDLLTGLSNRTGFYKMVREIQSEAAASNSRYALFFIDLDNFKDLNDAFGHEFGDQVLIQVAKRYKVLCGGNIRIARLGGDEFIMILYPASDDMIYETVDRILNLNNDKLFIQEKDIYLSASVGVAVYPDHADDYEALIRFADIAMYTAKKEGKMRYKLFDSSWFHLLKDKVKLSEDIRIALEKKQFIVYYQPEIDAVTGEIKYVEALIRWKHPDKGMISPMDFIPLAEETGKIPLIGFYVLQEVLDFKNRLKTMGYEKLPISINVSVKQIIEKDFIEQFSMLVGSAGIEPSQIIIEITESIFVESFEDINEKLNLLRERGFHIALDDFGTGYSSLSYLMRLPIQTLKIDKSFIDGVISNSISRSLIISIIEIAHNLGLKVVAEGVESKDQMVFLTEHGCDYIQGYYFSKPLPEEDLVRKLYSNA